MDSQEWPTARQARRYIAVTVACAVGMLVIGLVGVLVVGLPPLLGAWSAILGLGYFALAAYTVLLRRARETGNRRWERALQVAMLAGVLLFFATVIALMAAFIAQGLTRLLHG